MSKYHCLYSNCDGYKKVVEGTESAHLCAICGKEMASAEPPQNPNFVKAVTFVSKQMGNKYEHSFQKSVIGDVTTRPYFFKQDFISEMNRPIELAKFTGKSVRSSHKDKICVDNALKAVSFAFPKDYPKGEKFTFEVPYIMKLAGWEFMNKDDDIFKSKFTTLEAKVSPNKVYLVCTKLSSNEIGHMIVLTVNSKKEAFVTDAQKQPNNYGIYEFIAWKSKQDVTTIPFPYRPIDLSTGQFPKDKTWVDS
jgi:hypothetical protein